MAKYGIAHPKYLAFSNQRSAIRHLQSAKDQPWFVKVSGLAEGKGALPALTNKEAIEYVKNIDQFGEAASSFLLEDWLIGEEFSAFAISDGESFQLIGFAQDHKRVGNFDTGENTGGMGCVSNPKVVTADIRDQTSAIFKKTIGGLKKEGRPYVGILYLGAILVGKKVYVIEFNARWGDPEVEVILPGVQSDWFEVSLAVAQKKLNKMKIRVDTKVRVSVAAASRGYPGDYKNVKGKQIFGLEKISKLSDIKVYGAGVSKPNGKLVVSGGRIVHIVGEGKNVIEARQKAYQALSLLSVAENNLYYRTDIGWRDVERLRK
jgi:phosphoribosylamine--glycine ligase